MSTIRGRGRSLEIAIDRQLAEAGSEIREQLVERPDFFRGSRAVANLGAIESSTAEIAGFRDVLMEFGITLDAVSGPQSLAALVVPLQLDYLGESPVEVAAPPRRISRAPVAADSRSLVADFAGARADLAARRIEREAAGYERRDQGAAVASAGVTIPAIPSSAPAGISTLYHRGTLRGGQALHNLGNIVVIGDVNPGAELIASGDIVVFGALRGVAHAGAQGDSGARVVALELSPTQLRIATMIAAPEHESSGDSGPAHAYILGDRIAIVPHATADLGRREVPV